MSCNLVKLSVFFILRSKYYEFKGIFMIRNIFKNHGILIIFLLFCFFGPSFGDELEKIAVLQFETKGDLNVTDGGQIVADWILTAIGKTKEYTIVERDRLEDILSEYELNFSGIVDTDTAVEIGKISGVSIIVVGTISKFVDTITVSARMIDTETGYVIAVGDIKADDLNAIYDTIPDLVDQLLIDTDETEEVVTVTEKTTDKDDSKTTDEDNQSEIETDTQKDETLTLPDTVTPDKPKKEYVYPLRTAGIISLGVGVLSGGGGLLFDVFALQSS